MKGFATYNATKEPGELSRFTRKPVIHVRLYNNDKDIPEDVYNELVKNPKALEEFLKNNGGSFYDKEFGVNKDLYDFLTRDMGSINEEDPIDWFTNAIYTRNKNVNGSKQLVTDDSFDYEPNMVDTPYGPFDKGHRRIDTIADQFRNIFLDSHDFSPLLGPELDERSTPFIFDPKDPNTPGAKEQMRQGKKWYEVSPMPEKLWGFQFRNAPDAQWALLNHPVEHPAYNMNHPAWLEMEGGMPSEAGEGKDFYSYTPSKATSLPDVSAYIGQPNRANKIVQGVKHINEDATEPDVKPGEEVIITKDGNYIKLDPETGRYVPVKMKDVKLAGVPQYTDVSIPGFSEDAPEFTEDITEDIFHDPAQLDAFLKEHGVKGHGLVPRFADMWTGKTKTDKDGKPKAYDYIASVLRRKRRNSDDFMKPEDVNKMLADTGVQNAYIDNLIKSGYSLNELNQLSEHLENNPNEQSGELAEQIKKYVNWVKHHKWKKIENDTAPERMKDANGQEIFKIIEKPKLDEQGNPVLDENGKPVMRRVKVYAHKKKPAYMLLDMDDQQIRNRGIDDPLNEAPRKVSEAAKALRAFRKAWNTAKLEQEDYDKLMNDPASLTEEDVLKNYETKEKMMEALGPEHFDRLTGEIKYTPTMVLQELVDSLDSELSKPGDGTGKHAQDTRLINSIAKRDKYKKWIDMLGNYDTLADDIKNTRDKINSYDIDDPSIFSKFRNSKQKLNDLRQAIKQTGIPSFFMWNPENGNKVRGKELEKLIADKMYARDMKGNIVEKSRKGLNNDRRQSIKSMFKEKDPKRVEEIMKWFKSTGDEKAGIPALERTPENMYLFNELFPVDFWEDQIMQGKDRKDILRSMFPIYKNISAKNPGIIKQLKKIAREQAIKTQMAQSQKNIAGTLAGLNM